MDELGLSGQRVDCLRDRLRQPVPEGLAPDQEEPGEGLLRGPVAHRWSGCRRCAPRDESITVGDDSLRQEDVDASRKYLADYAEKLGVDVNPAYGRWEDGDVVIASGSLGAGVR